MLQFIPSGFCSSSLKNFLFIFVQNVDAACHNFYAHPLNFNFNGRLRFLINFIAQDTIVKHKEIIILRLEVSHYGG